MPNYPNGTAPAHQTKSTVFDAATNTSQHFNGSDWNDLKTVLSALKGQLVGSYRGYTHRRSVSTLTAVTVHTIQMLCDGRRKTVSTGRCVIPVTAGTYWVIGRGGTGAAVAVIRTAASEPAPYPTNTRDFPIAKLTKTVSALTIEQTRPDWILQHRV